MYDNGTDFIATVYNIILSQSHISNFLLFDAGYFDDGERRTLVEWTVSIDSHIIVKGQEAFSSGVCHLWLSFSNLLIHCVMIT